MTTSGRVFLPVEWRSYALYAASKVGPGLVMFAAVPIWTRTFGVEQYGLYSMCWVATLFSSAFFTGWLSQALLRHTGDSKFDVDKLPTWVVPTCAVVSAVPVVVIVFVESSSHSSADTLALVLSSAIFASLNSLYVVVQTRTQRNDRVGRFTAAEFVRIGTALTFSLLGAALFGGQGSVAIVRGYCVGTALGLWVLWERPRARAARTGRGSEVLTRFWSFGWPMTLWLTVSSMLLYSDRLVIGFLLGAEAVGTYGSISDVIVRGIGMLTFPITMRSHPAVMRVWNSGDRHGALRLTRRYTKFIIVICGVCVIPGSIFGSPVLESLLHVQIQSPVIVPALLAGAALWQIGLMSHKPLEMASRTKTMLATILSITIPSIGANFLLVPHLGLVAPAIVFCTGAALYVGATHYLSRRVKPVIDDPPGVRS